MLDVLPMAAIAICDRFADSRHTTSMGSMGSSSSGPTAMEVHIYESAYSSHLDFRARQKVHALDTRFMGVWGLWPGSSAIFFSGGSCIQPGGADSDRSYSPSGESEARHIV